MKIVWMGCLLTLCLCLGLSMASNTNSNSNSALLQALNSQAAQLIRQNHPPAKSPMASPAPQARTQPNLAAMLAQQASRLINQRTNHVLFDNAKAQRFQQQKQKASLFDSLQATSNQPSSSSSSSSSSPDLSGLKKKYEGKRVTSQYTSSDSLSCSSLSAHSVSIKDTIKLEDNLMLFQDGAQLQFNAFQSLDLDIITKALSTLSSMKNVCGDSLGACFQSPSLPSSLPPSSSLYPLPDQNDMRFKQSGPSDQERLFAQIQEEVDQFE